MFWIDSRVSGSDLRALHETLNLEPEYFRKRVGGGLGFSGLGLAGSILGLGNPKMKGFRNVELGRLGFHIALGVWLRL